MNKFGILIGIPAFWLAYDIIFYTREVSQLGIYKLFKYSFFIYVFHEPVLTVYKKILYFIVGKSELTSLFIYVIAPILTICTALIIGYLLKNYTPKVYSVLTGGR